MSYLHAARTIDITCARLGKAYFSLEVPDHVDVDEARDEIRDGTIPMWAHKQLTGQGVLMGDWELA